MLVFVLLQDFSEEKRTGGQDDLVSLYLSFLLADEGHVKEILLFNCTDSNEALCTRTFSF